MSRTLVVCNNEFLNTLYLMNLEVYLATTVVFMESAETAINRLRSRKDIDLIITLEMIDKKNAFLEIDEYRRAYGIKTPLIKIGGELDEEINVRTFGVASRFDIRAILKKSAAILGVTAKQMAEMKMSAYYPMSTNAIAGMTKAPCNLYIQKENGYKIIIWATDPVTDELRNLQDAGVATLYVRSSDRLVIVNNASLRIIEKISTALTESDGKSNEEKLNLLNDSFEFAAANLFSSDEIKKEMNALANTAAKVMSDVMKDTPQLKALLATLVNNLSGHIFVHSIVTSYVSNYLMKNITWGSDNQSDKINFVLFFHDIYLAPIYLRHPQLRGEKALLNNLILSEKENYTILHHARMAAELVVAYKRCPIGADILIKHHHGMKKGSGFANRYPEDLSTISKILLVAEAFTEHFLNFAEKGESWQMKDILPKLIYEFDSESYTKIVKVLVGLPI
jgi:hypothetical protein